MAEAGGILERLRGGEPPCNHTARTIAALGANPGCARRGVMDAAGVDKDVVARRLGFGVPYGQSQFAITRGGAFERQVKADECAELRTLLRERLGLSVDAPYVDLNSDEGRAARAARTREVLRGDALLDHPMLTLDIAGRTAYLEPDLVAVKADGRFHVLEIKSFAVIDGQADPEKVAAAARQSAVYVRALQAVVEDVSHDVILICPENFANRPTATFVDVRPQLSVLDRQFARLTRADDLIAALPDGLTFDSAEGVRAVPARYAPECMAVCELSAFCRDEARSCGSTGALGRNVRDDMGGVESVRDVLGLATGTRAPAAGQEEIAGLLRAAHRLRREALGA